MLTTAKSLLMIKNANEKVDILMCQVNNTFNTFNARKNTFDKRIEQFHERSKSQLHKK